MNNRIILKIVNILYNIKNIIFKIGYIMIIFFGIDFIGIYHDLFGFNLIKDNYAIIFVGIGFILAVPEYFFLAKEDEKKYGKYNARLNYYWVTHLLAGIFCIIIPFFI